MSKRKLPYSLDEKDYLDRRFLSIDYGEPMQHEADANAILKHPNAFNNLIKRPKVNYHNLEEKPKEKNYYNPNDYIQLSPKELEEQGKLVLEEMKKNVEWQHFVNVEVNKQIASQQTTLDK